MCQQYMIWRYRNILGHMKTWYYSKIFLNFINFSSMTFCDKNVSISANQSLSIPLDQNLLILLVMKIYNENIQTFWHRKLCMKTRYSSKSLTIFLIWFFGRKMFLYPQIVYYYRALQNCKDNQLSITFCFYRTSSMQFEAFLYKKCQGKLQVINNSLTKSQKSALDSC